MQIQFLKTSTRNFANIDVWIKSCSLFIIIIQTLYATYVKFCKIIITIYRNARKLQSQKIIEKKNTRKMVF